MRAAIVAWAAAWALGGCLEGLGGADTLPDDDAVLFQTGAQPVLEARCANPSCHGKARPLELYGVRLHRLDPADDFRAGPLSGEELALNRLRALAFVRGESEAGRTVLLRKPLAESAGGSRHVGGVQFPDREGREYRALERWVAEALVGDGGGLR